MDWRYSEERMRLRADVFTTLSKNNFTLNRSKQLYEFCHYFFSQGNNSIPDNIQELFERYVSETE